MNNIFPFHANFGFQICKRDNTDMLVLQSKRKRIEDTTKMYSKLRNSFDFLIS